MKTLEISMRPKAVKLFIWLGFAILVILAGFNYYLYAYKGFTGWKSLLMLLPAVILAWNLNGLIKKTKAGHPVLIFSEQSIEFFHPAKPVVFAWKDILEWKLNKNEGNTYLWIRSAEQKKECQINYLDKNFTEIEILMEEYIAYDVEKRSRFSQPN